MKMRPYQEEAVSKVIQLSSQVKRQLLLAATGAGKTIISTEILKRMNCKSLFLAHRDELIRQTKEKAQLVWKEANIGIVKGNENDVYAQIIVASVQTIVNRLDQIKEKVELIIIDECHHAVSPTYKKIIQYFSQKNPNVLIVGVTATPDRTDGKCLSEIFDQIVFEISMLDLIKMGYLVNIRGKRVETGIDLTKIKTVMGDYDERQLSLNYDTDQIHNLVVQNYLNYGENRLTVAFCCSVSHAKNLAAEFCRYGIPAASVDGTMKVEERREVLERFGRGDIRVITNCYVLTEGFDAPEVSCILLIRPTQSRGLYVQMVGRGLRLHKESGKKDCLLIDFAGNTENHQLVTLLSILGSESDQKKYRREKQEDLIEDEIDTQEFIEKQIAQEAYQKAFESKISLPMLDMELLPKESHFDWNPLMLGYSLNMGKGSVLLLPSQESQGRNWNVWAYISESESFQSMSLDPFPTLGTAQEYAEKLIEKRKNEPMIRGLIQKKVQWKQEPVSKNQQELLGKYRLPIPKTKGEAAKLLDRMKITQKLIECKMI